MSSGNIYLAETSLPHPLKAGRFGDKLSLSDKERQYKTIDRNFKIRYCYASDNVEKEEARVLSVLRLVGGTDFKGAGRETFNLTVDEAIRAIGCETPAKQRELANRAILALKLGDDRVDTYFQELDQLGTIMAGPPTKTSVSALPRYFNIVRTLAMAGISVFRAGEEQNLSVSVYLCVTHPVKLLGLLPDLKVYQSVLQDLCIG